MAYWWSNALVYQLYPRSFQDSNGDGIGDIQGVIQRLPVLSELGLNTLWLSPVYPSPQVDFGYDISNYTDVDPLFGSLNDLKMLIQEARNYRIRIMMDGVFNHCSAKHPWFLESIDPKSEKHHWFHWAKAPPNNWGSVFGGAAWSQHPKNGLYYLHTFDRHQPDFNWANPQVREAILSAMTFWFDLGILGFRLDVFNCYAKAEGYPNNPPHPIWWRRLGGVFYPYIGQRHVYDRDVVALHSHLAELRQLADRYDAVLLGETLDEVFQYDKAASYVNECALHSAFNFRLLHSSWQASAFKAAIQAWLSDLSSDQVPVWAFSNHDFPRLATRWGKERVRGALALLFFLPGVPVLYNGDELGMTDGKLRRDQIQDPPGQKFWPFYKGRDGCRTPLYWDDTENAGFTTGRPWLPINPEAQTAHQKAQAADPTSVWNWTRRLLQIRKQHPELATAPLRWCEEDDLLLHFWRDATEEWHFFLNMGRKPYPIKQAGTCVLTGKIIQAGDLLAPSEGLCLQIKKPSLQQ